MKTIFHFNTFDHGGAASAAHRFHNSLQNSGHRSLFFVLEKTRRDSSIIKIVVNRYKRIIDNLLNKYINRNNFFSDQKFYFDFPIYQGCVKLSDFLKRQQFLPDAIVLYDVNYFIDFDDLRILFEEHSCKIFWYPMDMSPFTGGCHYSWGCKGFIQSCESCPALYSPFKSFAKRKLHKINNFVKFHKIESLSASFSLRRQIENSKVFSGDNQFNLMLGIDPDVFKPSDDLMLIRNKFSVPGDSTTILITLVNPSEVRKGYQYIVEALQFLYSFLNDSSSKVHLLLVGHRHFAKNIEDIGFSYSFLGYLSSDSLLSEAYQAADLFISTSIEDSGPMMINESLMTGTPVVSFRMGVAEDLIINDVTGYLADLYDSMAVCLAIHKFISLTPDERLKMKENCRNMAIKMTSNNKQVNDFIGYL